MVDECWSLTYDEDTHDDNENERYILLIPVSTHICPSSLSAFQRLDQLHVKKGDEQEWPAVDDDEVEDVGVNDAIQSIVAEVANNEDFACLVDRNTHYLTFVLEESYL